MNAVGYNIIILMDVLKLLDKLISLANGQNNKIKYKELE